jgi:signal transduction histidine kinase
LALLAWLAMVSAGAALDLLPGKARPDIVPDLLFLKDDGHTLKDVIADFRRQRFQPDIGIFNDARSGFEPVWMAVELTNRSDNDGRPADEWILTSDKPLQAGLEVYLIRPDGLTETLLDFDNSQPFDPENRTLTGLRSGPVTLAGGETALLIVRYQSGLIHSIRMGLQTPQSLADRAVDAGVGFAAFYAFSVAGLMFFCGFNISMRNRVGIYYSGLFALGLMLLAYIDGFLFRFFWPARPIFDIYMGNVIFLAMSALGLFSASRSLVSDGRETVWSRTMLALSLVAAGIIALIPVFGFAVINLLIVPIYLLFGLMFAANIVATAKWRQTEGNVHLFANITAALAGIVIVGLLFAVFSGIGFQLFPVHIITKLVYATITLTTMVGLTAHIVVLRRDHQSAQKRELEALAQEAEKSRALLEAEKNYSRARDLAQLRQTQLATASHDLKQPLASLRMTMDAIANDRDPEIQARLREAFDYMEGLTASYLAETRPEEGTDISAGGGDAPEPEDDVPDGNAEEAAEPYEVSLILRTVHQMFNEEAISKGLRLRMVDCSEKVAVPPLVLMRIVSNLVSNAVKYTESGKVLFGCRRGAGHIRIQVHDTGQGMSEEMLADLLQPYRKGEKSDGEGLGLAICAQLAGAHGLRFDARSEPGRGTCFELTVPRA